MAVKMATGSSQDKGCKRLHMWVPELLELRHCVDQDALLRCCLQIGKMAVESPQCWSQVVRKRYMGSTHWSPRFALLENKTMVAAGLARVNQILKASKRQGGKGVVSAAAWRPNATPQDDLADMTCDVFFSTPSVSSTAFL